MLVVVFFFAYFNCISKTKQEMDLLFDAHELREKAEQLISLPHSLVTGHQPQPGCLLPGSLIIADSPASFFEAVDIFSF